MGLLEKPDTSRSTVDAARFNEKGIEETRRRHFDEGIEALRAAIRSDRKQPAYWNNLGSVYLTIDKPILASRCFRRAIGIDPNNALAWYNLGAARDALLDYDGAIENYARALELDPSLRNVSKNPSVVNNTHMAAISLTLYRKQAGALGAPLSSPGSHTEGRPAERQK